MFAAEDVSQASSLTTGDRSCRYSSPRTLRCRGSPWPRRRTAPICCCCIRARTLRAIPGRCRRRRRCRPCDVHNRIDRDRAACPRDRHAVVPVNHRVAVVDLDDLDRRQNLATLLGGRQPLPAGAGRPRRPAGRGGRLPAATRFDRRGDRVERDLAHAAGHPKARWTAYPSTTGELCALDAAAPESTHQRIGEAGARGAVEGALGVDVGVPLKNIQESRSVEERGTNSVGEEDGRRDRGLRREPAAVAPFSAWGWRTVVRPARGASGTSSTPVTESARGTGTPRSAAAWRTPIASTLEVHLIAVGRFARSSRRRPARRPVGRSKSGRPESDGVEGHARGLEPVARAGRRLAVVAAADRGDFLAGLAQPRTTPKRWWPSATRRPPVAWVVSCRRRRPSARRCPARGRPARTATGARGSPRAAGRSRPCSRRGDPSTKVVCTSAASWPAMRGTSDMPSSCSSQTVATPCSTSTAAGSLKASTNGASSTTPIHRVRPRESVRATGSGPE